MEVNSDFKITISGLDDVLEFIDGFPNDALQIVNTYIKRELNKFVTTPLKNQLGYIKDSNRAVAIISVSKTSAIGGITKKFPGYKSNWTQEGTEERLTKKGLNRGRIIGRNEIKPILEGATDYIISDVETNMSNDFDQLIRAKLNSNNRKLKKLLG